MKIVQTEYSRKIDAMGRIGIPIRLRNQYGLEVGKELDFHIIEIEGTEYLAIKGDIKNVLCEN
jgi:bifunctional DNA-binding transcriptional regulator/antitoxin component of YhaV-PrlF toxin-antitoxin module